VSIQRFRPEIWSANLLVALRKTLIYGSSVNHDYEGEIASAGDTVRITSIGRPTIANYIPNTTVIVPEQVNDSQRVLVVDQSKYFAFEVDDVDARQAAGNVIPQSMNEAAYAFADIIDQYIASFYTGIQASNVVGPVTVTTTGATPNYGDVYDKCLVPIRVSLDRANVPMEGRWAIVAPEVYGVLLRDSRFVKVNESGGSEGLRNGVVGRAAGFDIQVSNNAPSPVAGQYAVVAGNNTAVTFASQINKVEAYRPQSSFADAVKGLMLYGAKLIRPDSMASALVTVI